jgi:cephalosporin hydroxylase
VKSVIEVGSFVGGSAIWFAQRVDSVVCVDHFNPGTAVVHPRSIPDNTYAEFVTNTLPYPNIRGIRMDSLEAALLPIVADMVYIDADHTVEAVYADVDAWRSHALKVICGDDNGNYGVTEAIKRLGIPDSGERIWWTSVT